MHSQIALRGWTGTNLRDQVSAERFSRLEYVDSTHTKRCSCVVVVFLISGRWIPPSGPGDPGLRIRYCTNVQLQPLCA
eukprot:3012519-Rhodomonas_salina.1